MQAWFPGEDSESNGVKRETRTCPLPRPSPLTWSPPPGTRPPVTLAPTGVGGRRWGGSAPTCPRSKGHIGTKAICSLGPSLLLQAALPAPTSGPQCFPRAPSLTSLLRPLLLWDAEKRPAGPQDWAGVCRSGWGLSRTSLGKETIWSLKEPQGTDPRLWELAQARHRHLQRTAGRSQRPVSTRPGPAKLTPMGERTHTPPTREVADNLTPPQPLTPNLPEKPEHSPEDNSALHPPGRPRGSTCTGPRPPPRTCPRPLQEPGQVRGGER